MPKSTKEKEDSELELINLEDLFKRYAESLLDKGDKKRSNLDNPVINWGYMHVTHGETEYVQSTEFAQPTAQVLFTANFTNDTPQEKTYALRTERRTKSICTVSFKKTFTFGCSLRLNITPPTTVIGAAVGFRREIAREKGVVDTSDRDLMWSVDTHIQVPSGSQTTAKLIIKEDHYSGDFTIRSTFEGKVIVTYEDKETKEHVYTVSCPVKEVLGTVKEFTKDNQGRPVFVVRGVCDCRYGIEQNVSLTESPIPPSNSNE